MGTGVVGCGYNIDCVAEMDYFIEHFTNYVPGNSRIPQDGYVYFKRKAIGEKKVMWSKMFGKY